ncbi:MAG: NADH-quinone oxidoreductase subunit C, partial [Chloroflexota bacterium]
MKTIDADKRKAALSKRFGDAITATVAPDGVLEAVVAPPQAVSVLQTLKEEYDFHQLHDLTAVDYIKDGKITVVYRLMNVMRPDMMVVKVPLDRNEPEVGTATSVYPAANWLEREVYDYFGVKFLDHPNLTRIMTWDGFQGHPFRKDFSAFDQDPPESEPHETIYDGTQSDGPLHLTDISPNGNNGAPRTVILNFGPQHPSTHGVFRAVAELDGETIVDMKPVVGYLHRGLEKIAEMRTWAQVIPYTDRTDYLATMNNNQAYVMA